LADKVTKTTARKKRAASGNNGKLKAGKIEHFKKLLLAKRRQLVGDVNGIHDEALKNSRSDATGDLSSMPIHMADIGTDTYDQEFALNLMKSERTLLKKIDEALLRISKGKYGICDGTGKPIAIARLEAKPWARYSLAYALMIEKGLVNGEPQ